MKITVQRSFALAGACLIVAAIVWAFLPKPVAVDLGEVIRSSMQVTVDEDGITRVRERYVVSSPLSGRLRRIELEAGDPVRAGKTLLAVIEPGDPQLLDARTRNEALARVKAAEAAVRRTTAEVERALAAHELAESEWERTRRLFDTGVISRQEFEQAQAAERTAREDLKVAEYALQIARFEEEQARATLLQFTGDPGGNSEPHEIKAPVDGRVLRLFEESESIVGAGSPLLELGDPADLEIVVDVLSADGVKIEPGARMILEHWGGAEPLEARVRLVEPSAFLKISALGVEEQRVNVIGDLVDPPGRRPSLGDAFRVEARIVVWEGEDVLKVPTSALFREQDQWAVFVEDNGSARLQIIEVGHQNGMESEVVSGLAEGQRVILHPGDAIEDGIQIVERTAE